MLVVCGGLRTRVLVVGCEDGGRSRGRRANAGLCGSGKRSEERDVMWEMWEKRLFLCSGNGDGDDYRMDIGFVG